MPIVRNMKTCSKCETEKAYDAFYKRVRSTDGYSPWCKQCHKEYDQVRWAAKDGIERERKRLNEEARRNRLRNELFAYLKEHPCVDCSEADIVVLEFDHLRDKEFNIADGFSRSYNWTRILKEIEKCEVVCANCHKRRTAKRGNWAKLLAQLEQ